MKYKVLSIVYKSRNELAPGAHDTFVICVQTNNIIALLSVVISSVHRFARDLPRTSRPILDLASTSNLNQARGMFRYKDPN